jgi:hypothetical protein
MSLLPETLQATGLYPSLKGDHQQLFFTEQQRIISG